MYVKNLPRHVGDVEYTDCISAESLDTLPTIVLDMTLNHLIVRLQSWRFKECRVSFHFHYSQVHSDREMLYLLVYHQ